MYKPRPHLPLRIRGRPFLALLDTGSEASFVSPQTAAILETDGFPTKPATGRVHLANGSNTRITGYMTLPVATSGPEIWHDFQIMPGLDAEILAGVDFWARLRQAIPPPPIKRAYAATPRQVAETCHGGLTPSEQRHLREFLDTELPLFENVRGPTDRIQHAIRIHGHPPIKQRYRPRNPAMQAIIDTEVEGMLREGVIEPSRSAWSSPIVIVKKKDGKPRFCVDFRRVNEVTEPDAYPLPQIAATLDKLRGAKYLTTLDLKSGYWQVPLDTASRPVTAFTVPGKGLFQFRVMPFGLHSAPATFQRLLDAVLGPELEPHVFVYLDDIIIVNSAFDEHIRTIQEVFRRLREARLRLNPDKCKFCVDQLTYLGHVVDREGIRTDPDKTKAIAEWEPPRNVKQWGTNQQEAFNDLKRTLTTAPVLACPDFSRQFVLQTDASTTGLGAVLTQNFPEGERVIAYASRTLNSAERNYSATELECLAVVWGIRRMRCYLEGYRFKVITDHQSLRWLSHIDSPTGRLGRWAFELQQYNFEIQYRKGTLNRVADALSRRHATHAITLPDCAWYRRTWRAVRNAPREHPDLRIEGNRLRKHLLHTLDFRDTPPETQWKECVPTKERGELLRRYHDEPTAGHLGVAKTIARIAEHYYWPGMFGEISRYVRRCRECLAHKPAQTRPAGLLHPTTVTRPWQQVTIDLIGPLPRTTRGNTWVLTMQDRFTRWLEVRTLRRASASSVVSSLSEAIILRHGCPEKILSDNGTQLRSSLFEQLLVKSGIRHRLAPAYAPHCNPVERTNRIIKTMMAQYVRRNHRAWDEHIGEFQFAYNTARHDATGYSPAFLLYGRELRRPTEPATKGRTPRHSLQQRLQEAYELVRIKTARAFQHQEKYYNLRRRDWRPKIGEWVWKRDHPLSKRADAFNAKLASKFIGPLEVRRIVSPVIVDLRGSSGKWYRHIHTQDLKVADPPQAADTEDVNTSEE
ncbi:uncharacterized protein K02A2.6-like [Monomorium pharaonis]|uniref:uncharacterized protein K02A2.6-like n=1 Tax=Monomorium pharaonis TaxID=307658 RepID=UPI001746B2C4|nr:uncharacterized protein K02A2.6-like [Monomorium pharaonis]